MKTNEQAKQEAIRKAYGKEIWDIIGHTMISLEYPWCSGILLVDKQAPDDYDSNDWDFDNSGNMCPKSLRNIQDNNGWVRIEPDGSNLPTDKKATFNCGILDTDGVFKKKETNVSLDRLIAHKKYFTHYKPIKQELKPIY